MENKEILEAIQTRFDKLQEKSISSFISKEDYEKGVKEINESVKELAEKPDLKEDLEAVKEFAEKLEADLTLIKESQSTSPVNTAKEFKKELAEKLEVLKEKNVGVERLKAVGTMTFTDSVTGTIPQADRDPGVNDLNKRVFTIRALSDVGMTNANVKEWVYKTAKEGSAGMTAEGAAKTQVDWTYVVDSANVKKITSYIKISKEMLDDIDGIMSDINGELKYEVDYLEETQLIEGTGLTVYVNGIEKYAQALDATGLVGTIAIPNKWDVIGAAIKQISIETEGKASANAILMNPADVFAMVHGTRTTTDEYNAPMAVVEANGTRIYGLPVIESNSITAGEFLVGDFTKFHIRDKEQLNVAIGYENDDWTKNLVTILAEKRLVSYVKKNDENAFVTDTFVDGITFLTASS